MSIAARVGDVTPAQLARFNKLGMLGASHPPLFPGQRLYIPNKDEVSAQNIRLRHIPGAATRIRKNFDQTVSTMTSTSSTEAISEALPYQEGVMERLFVKVKSKRVLLPSKSEIDGLLIITPDAVCFDALATASALNRANAAKRQDNPRLPPSDTFVDAGVAEGTSQSSSPPNVSLAASSPLSEPILEAAEPVHDVMALSVCIPIAAVVSLNTHGDIYNLIAMCHTKTSKRDSRPKELSVSMEIEIPPPKDSSEKSEQSSTNRNQTNFDDVPESDNPVLNEKASAESQEKNTLPEEVYISIGVDTERILSYVASNESTLNADHTTLSEAASTSLHVFKIPLDNQTDKHEAAQGLDESECRLYGVKDFWHYCLRSVSLTEIHDILVSATNLFASQSASSESNEANTFPTTKKNQRPISIIEAALKEMENSTLELTLSGGTSCILSGDMLKDVATCLPTNRISSSMRLVFSTARDGFSLNTLYRKTRDVQDINVLLIRDQMGTAFGALLSEKMHCSQRFYGTGESCVFHWRNGFKCYNWTRKNYFFMQGSKESFLIGVKNGHCAIWFDGDLKYGRSEATDTFDNPVLCSLPKTSNSNGRDNSSGTAWTNLIPSSASSVPTSVAFIISALELWEVVS
ncbi:hypothetical protein Aperf_G00000062093 [Anoplocephala perfoliata]